MREFGKERPCTWACWVAVVRGAPIVVVAAAPCGCHPARGMTTPRTAFLIVSIAAALCACDSEAPPPSDSEPPNKPSSNQVAPPIESAAPRPPMEGPTLPQFKLPPQVPEEEREILEQQARIALARNYDSRCPDGMTAFARNKGHDHGVPSETLRTPPTAWDGPEVAIQFPKPNHRVSQGTSLLLKASMWGSGIVWFSDLDGELGRKSTMQLPASCLTAGTHRIEARAMQGSQIIALGSVEVFVLTAIEAIQESARTPDVRPVLQQDWVLSGPNQTVEIRVRNYGGGDAEGMTMVVNGNALESAEGLGWHCRWHQLQNGKPKTDENARNPSSIRDEDPCGAFDCCIGILDAMPTREPPSHVPPNRELRCTYERDLPGAQASLPLRLRVSSEPTRQSLPEYLSLHAAVSVPGEINTNDNDSELLVEVVEEEPVEERLQRRPFEYTEVTGDPDFGSRRRGRHYLHAGPMLVRIDEARIEAERNAAVIELYATPQLAIPNVPRDLSTSRVRLWVDSVVGGNGQSLGATGLGAVVAEGHAYRKSILLDEGVHSWEAAEVNGRVEVDVPIHVGRVRIDRPARGSRFERHGVTLAVVDAMTDLVSFRLEGDTSRVLEIRALNADGQPLAPGEARPQGAWKPGDNELWAYGQIAAIELFVTEESQTLTFPFSLPLSPRGGVVDTSGLDDVFEPFSMAKLKQKYEEQAVNDVLAYVASERLLTRDGPVLATQLASAFFLELVRVNHQGALNPGIRINVPRLPNLEYTFGHLIFQIDYVHLRDGTIISPKTIADLRERPQAHDGVRLKLSPKHAEAAWATYVWVSGLSGTRRAWHTWLSLPLGLEERNDVAMLEGRLTYRIPKSIRWHTFRSANPGERIQTPKLEAQLRSVGNRSTTVEVARGGDRVMAIYWLDDESRRTGPVRSSSLAMPPTASWTHVFRTGNRFNLAIAVGDRFKTVEYPVRLKIPLP